MRYSLTEVNIDDKHMERLKSAIENNKAAMIRIFLKRTKRKYIDANKRSNSKNTTGTNAGKR
jgi:uncharacterized membrane protein